MALLVNNGETMLQVAPVRWGSAFHVADAIKAGKPVLLLEGYNPGDLEMIHAIYLGGGHVPVCVRAFIDRIAETVARSPLFNRTN